MCPLDRITHVGKDVCSQGCLFQERFQSKHLWINMWSYVVISTADEQWTSIHPAKGGRAAEGVMESSLLVMSN